MKLIFNTAMAFAVMLFCQWGAHAQGYIAPNASLSDMVAANPHTPQNTANSSFGNVVTVSCWDGTNPSFSYDFNGGMFTGVTPLNGNTLIPGQLPLDPDIVVFPGSVKFMIVYIIQGRVYAEMWHGGGAVPVLLCPATLISYSSELACYNPNIDQLENGAAIVWQSGGAIHGRYLNAVTCPASPALGPRVTLNACAGVQGSHPDVSIYKDGPNDVANVVFVGEPVPGSKGLYIQRIDLDDFHAGIVPCAGNWDVLIPASTTHTLSYPRVASPPIGAAGVCFQDCQVVVELQDGSGSNVIGINRTACGPYNASILNFDGASLLPDTRTCINTEPVVTYTSCSDIILVEWAYYNWSSCIPTLMPATANIIGRRLNMNGTPIAGIETDNYSKINTTAGWMHLPAVAGRYRFASGLGAQSTYCNSATFDILWRYNSCYMGSLKTEESTIAAGEEASSLEVYPNPVQELLTIALPLSSDVGVYNIVITDLQGRQVDSWTVSSALNQTEWDASGVSTGLYMVSVEASNGERSIATVMKSE